MTLFFTSFGRAGLWLAAVALAVTAVAQGLPEGVVAVVAGKPITTEAFEREMALRGGDIPGQYATLEQRRALLDEIIRFRALVARARELGYDSDPDVVAVLERTMVTKLQHKELDRQLEAVTVSDEEVAEHWAAHRDQYARPARYKGAIVFIAVSLMASEEKRAELERRAEQALEEAGTLGPETLHFGPVARKYSDDRASRYQGGVIGWLVEHANRQYKWAPEVVDAIFALSTPGEIAPIVHTDEGLYLVRLAGREAGSERPLDQVGNGIRHRLLRDKRQELRETFLGDVVAEADVRVNTELLELIGPPTPAAERTGGEGPPPLPAR